MSTPLTAAKVLTVPTCDYNATIADVHDGDTLTAVIELFPGETFYTSRVRFAGINAPELPTAAGKTSLAWLVSFLGSDKAIVLRIKHSTPRDDYGRVLATVFKADGTDVCAASVAAGQSAVYPAVKVKTPAVTKVTVPVIVSPISPEAK